MLRKDKKRKNRGWVPFGYRYLGPGNDLHNGKPTTEGDKVAQKHDWKYHEIEQITSRDPKYQYYEEDDDFINELKPKYASEWIAKNLFRAKRKLAELGWLEDMRPRQKSRRETTLRDYKEFTTPNRPKRKRDEKMSPGDRIRARRIDMSFDNLLPSREMPEGGNNLGSGHEHGLTETPVDRVPYQVYRGPPDQIFASLPFYNEITVNQDMWAYDMAWRPTSVYDCQVDFSGSATDLNLGTGVTSHWTTNPFNATDVTVNKPRWFDYYASIYKYYHVIACRYEFYVENKCTEDVWVHMLPYNDTLPPINATNVDMLQWNDCDSVCLSSRTIAITSSGHEETQNINTNVDMDEASATAGQTPIYETGNHLENQLGKKAHLFKGVYKTGDYDRQIRLDANVENWTAVTTNPTLSERLMLRIKPHWDSYSTNDTSNRNRPIKILVRAKLEYLVEFKELKDGLKYPTNDQPYVASLNTGS